MSLKLNTEEGEMMNDFFEIIASALEDSGWDIDYACLVIQAVKSGRAIIVRGGTNCRVLIDCMYTYCDDPKLFEDEQHEIWDIRHPDSLNKIMEWLNADPHHS